MAGNHYRPGLGGPPRRLGWFPTPGAGVAATSYALTCDVGAYVYTGVDATVGIARKLPCATGAYVYAGKTATIGISRQLPLATGAYTYAGINATLTVARQLPMDTGIYSYAGQDATFVFTGVTPVVPAAGGFLFVPDVSVIARQKKRKPVDLRLLLIG